MATNSAPLSGRAVRLYVEANNTGTVDAANNRSLIRVRGWVEKDNLSVYTYNLDSQYGSAISIDGPAGRIYSNSRNITYDFRPSGQQVWLMYWDFNLWVAHNSSGGGSIWLAISVTADVIGSASAGVGLTLPNLFTAPGVPTSPSVSNIGSTQVTYNATDGSNGGAAITERRVQISENAGFTVGVRDIIVDSFNNALITDLTPLTTYWIQSRAKNQVGWGGFSNQLTFTTIDVPGTPTMEWKNATPHSLNFRIYPPNYTGGTLLGRQYQLALDPEFTQIVGDSTSDINDITFESLPTQHTKYYYRGRVQNSVGWSPWSQTGMAMTTGPALVAWHHNGTEMKRCAVWVCQSDLSWKSVETVWIRDELDWRPTP